MRGEPYQFFLNTPWGENLENQYAKSYTSFSSRFRFNGKEWDEETGNFYYGARYYDPKISVWLSVDPMAHLRTWVSPYNFVQNNPIIRVDLTGMLDDIYVTGEGAYDYVKQLQSRTKMTVKRDQETGRITFEGKARNKFDKALVSASKSVDYDLRIETTKTEGEVFFGGAFMGASQNSETGKLDVKHFVNTNVTGAVDKVTKNKGLGVGHETIEGFLIGEYMTENGITSTTASSNANPNPIFEQAHEGTRKYRVDQERNFSVSLPTWAGSKRMKVYARGKEHEIHSVTGEIRK